LTEPKINITIYKDVEKYPYQTNKKQKNITQTTLFRRIYNNG